MEVIYDIDIGDTIVCDWCNMEYTDSPERGGALVGSDAVCPVCVRTIKYEGRMKKCPAYMTFKDFVLRARKGNNHVTITVDN